MCAQVASVCCAPPRPCLRRLVPVGGASLADACLGRQDGRRSVEGRDIGAVPRRAPTTDAGNVTHGHLWTWLDSRIL